MVGLCLVEIRSLQSLCWLLKPKARQAEPAPRQAPLASGEGMGVPWVCAGMGCPSLGGGGGEASLTLEESRLLPALSGEEVVKGFAHPLLGFLHC